ncbi:MAG: uridine kinase family protein [Gulosibacter sp.]|uniref:uridine kinase family protein n=1 Tax=Gulosibacter sp. TaxID=2817531 RepID=UPI003F9195F8
MRLDLNPGPGEPTVRDWEEQSFSHWLTALLSAEPDVAPTIIAIDGRGGSGKTTLAYRIQTALNGVEIVSTDDIAWHHSILSWHDLLVEHVLQPVRRGEAVRYRPDAWARRDRQGAIAVSADVRILVIEGTGSLNDRIQPYLDRGIWVQSDYDLAREGALDRDEESGVNGDRAAAAAFWDDWQREEVPYLIEQQPWQKADSIVCGTGPYDRGSTDILVAAS